MQRLERRPKLGCLKNHVTNVRESRLKGGEAYATKSCTREISYKRGTRFTRPYGLSGYRGVIQENNPRGRRSAYTGGAGRCYRMFSEVCPRTKRKGNEYISRGRRVDS